MKNYLFQRISDGCPIVKAAASPMKAVTEFKEMMNRYDNTNFKELRDLGWEYKGQYVGDKMENLCHDHS